MLLQFDYFYGNEAEQFTFFRIPKVLFRDERFKDMSTDAKLLYGLMLDRMGLSIRNQWLDEDNRVYIIYRVEEIIEDIGCARQKVSKLLDELDNNVGLIERKRQGLGKPNIIYVKNFIVSDSVEFENQNCRSMIIENPEVRKSNLQKYENHTSESMNIILQEVPKSYSNNTNINNTNISDTEYSDTEYNDTEINNHILSYPIEQDEKSDNESNSIGWIRERNSYEKIIKSNVEYDITIEKFGKKWLDEIIELMVDVICSKNTYIRINKQEYPHEVVKSRFLKIDSSHIEYIYFALKENHSDVRNIRAFLITTIYRSFETSDNWFSSRVNYDMVKYKNG